MKKIQFINSTLEVGAGLYISASFFAAATVGIVLLAKNLGFYDSRTR